MDAIKNVGQVVNYFGARKRVYVRLYIFSTTVIVGISLLITICGALGWPLVSACLGAFSACAISLEKAFSLSDKRALYKYAEGEGRALEWEYTQAASDEARVHIEKRLRELLLSVSRFDSQQVARGLVSADA